MPGKKEKKKKKKLNGIKLSLRIVYYWFFCAWVTTSKCTGVTSMSSDCCWSQQITSIKADAYEPLVMRRELGKGKRLCWGVHPPTISSSHPQPFIYVEPGLLVFVKPLPTLTFPQSGIYFPITAVGSMHITTTVSIIVLLWLDVIQEFDDSVQDWGVKTTVHQKSDVKAVIIYSIKGTKREPLIGWTHQLPSMEVLCKIV